MNRSWFVALAALATVMLPAGPSRAEGLELTPEILELLFVVNNGAINFSVVVDQPTAARLCPKGRTTFNATLQPPGWDRELQLHAWCKPADPDVPFSYYKVEEGGPWFVYLPRTQDLVLFMS